MSQDCNTTLPSSTPTAGKIPYKVRLNPDTPLTGFNQLFPRGLPTAQAEPNLSIGEWECYEAILPSTLDTADLTIALFQPDTPDEICRVWLEWGIVALPVEWVEAV